MSIKNYTREQIEAGLANHEPALKERIRLLFVNNFITDENFDRICRLYSNLKGSYYDTVVIIEKYPGNTDKLLPLVSNETFDTPLGSVLANDPLRNDFCDEDDDFFLDDSGYSENMALYDHLMMLQCVLKDFNVVSIQIADSRPSIVRELAAAIEELLRERNALVVLCSNISESEKTVLNDLYGRIKAKETSRLFNFLNTGDARIRGTGPFMAGVLVADKWELDHHFISLEPNKTPHLAGCATLKKYQG